MSVVKSFRAILALCISFSFLSFASAQVVAPTNGSISGNPSLFVLTTNQVMGNSTIKIYPLTNDAGLAGSQQQLNSITITGRMLLINSSNPGTIQGGDIVYISCEPTAYTEPLNATKTISLAIQGGPGAIVLYSTVSSRCTFTPADGFNYNVIYTMADASTSMMLEKGLSVNSLPDASTTIKLAQQQNNGGGDAVGKSPSTAVAMIILYSITGIITALFLIIIVVGALRAHRHPERYGPRHVMGRARQSRARGIARAMLETLPIVKFGEWENQKPAPGAAVPQPRTAQPNPDVELGTVENANDTTSPTTTEHLPTQPSHTTAATTATTSPTSPTATPANITTETHPGRTPEASDATNADNGLACSVCTDDFVKGQDIRVLPCNHKFHPECIDPWLLNVSGTCPLCRVDLRPTKTHDSSNETGPAEGTHEVIAEPYAQAPSNRRSRGLSSYLGQQLNIHRMRDATPQERIAALREVRTHQQGSHVSPQTDGSPSERLPARNRMSARISRAFHRDSRPQSTVAEARPAADGPAGGISTSTTREREDRGMNEM